ncbi:MAG: hypothetical protein AAGA25_13135, partial [Planctomycetota bacterium]
QMAEAQRGLEGNTKQLESLERRLAQLKDQLEGQARRSKPASGPVQETWKKELSTQGKLLAAQLRAAELEDQPPFEAQENTEPANPGPKKVEGEREIQPGSKPNTSANAEAAPSDPTSSYANRGSATNQNIYHDWEPNLEAVIGALNEVRQVLNLTRARDPLTSQRAGQSPAEYRRLVNLYFESLSRNAVHTTKEED